jgi:outer membrane protein OmpA-like peptidoglycan-associated protein
LPARFAFNARTPRGDAAEIAAVVARCDGAALLLTGHADAVGSASINDEIALARADAVRALLVEHGVDAARVRIVSAGATQPIASNENARGRRDNRRVTLHCEPHNGGEP